MDMTAKDVEVEKKEEEFKKEATDKEQELRRAGGDLRENDFVVETSEVEDGSIEQPHVWTYVLVNFLFNQLKSISVNCLIFSTQLISQKGLSVN